MSSDTLSTIVVVLGPVAVGAILGLVTYYMRGRRSRQGGRRRRPPD